MRFRVRGGKNGEVCWGILGCFEIWRMYGLKTVVVLWVEGVAAS